MKNRQENSKKGIAQLPLILGLLLIGLALPVALKLVQQRQETRRGATHNCYCLVDGDCVSKTFSVMTCAEGCQSFGWSVCTPSSGTPTNTPPPATNTPPSSGGNDCSDPGQPQVEVIDITANGATIRWNPVSNWGDETGDSCSNSPDNTIGGCGGERGYVGQLFNGNNQEVEKIECTGNRTWTLTGLTAGETYQYKIWSVNKCGCDKRKMDTFTTTTNPTNTPTATPTEAETENWPVLNFKVKMKGTEYQVQGEDKVVEDIPEQKMTVIVRKGSFEKEFKNVDVSFDKNAVGEGSVVLNGVEPGDKYAILVKGPVHLARKFCKNNQTDRCAYGQEKITLTEGENNFDLTGLYLEPGDINSDGRVDSADFTLLKQAVGKKRSAETGENIPEDLNFNGVVNSQDIVLFLETLSTKYEDDY